jgi:tRNA-2-methylthio-N6-dimethylallyladenosine synthase
VAVTGFDKGDSGDFLGIHNVYPQESSSFVTIMKGCNEHCRYCIVPDVRGPERNRDFLSIEQEVRRLVDSGIKEVTLLGQKVNAYEFKGETFASLLQRLDKNEGLQRLRFTSPHPRHMTSDVTDLYGNLRTLCNSIHLPVQSGSNTTLKRMGRRYTREDYLDIVKRLRDRMPDIAISTDLIIGYPGESEQDFLETLSLIDEVAFSSAFSFKFSPRPGTPAFKLEDDISEAEKSARLDAVHKLVNKYEQRFKQSLLNQTLDVLVESEGRISGQLSGRAGNFQIVNFMHPLPLNQMAKKLVSVKISKIHPNSLEGVAVE